MSTASELRPASDVAAPFPAQLRVIDSHTEGEPTRVVVEGWPPLRGATMAERRDDLRSRFDQLRRAVVCEPRGHSAIVGAVLTDPVTPGAAAGIVFFNNETYLGMCGHGLIGVVRTLQHVGRLTPGTSRFDTPVGVVTADLAEDGVVTIHNVPAHVHALDVSVEVAGLGRITGDVAWGGNWFFITHWDRTPLDMAHVAALTRETQAIQDALRAAGLASVDGGEIDHIELSGAPVGDADARNFVLCSGGEYDRSPCGTGTSAKLAVLAERGELAIGERWRQESVTGGRFTGWLTRGPAGELLPHVSGRAFVTAEATLRFDPADPFRTGLPAA